MTIREPFEWDYAPAYFEPGTRTVYFYEPINQTPANTRYYVAKRFQFEEGEYQIKLEFNDGGTLWLGETSLDSRMIMSAYQAGNPPVPTSEVYLQTGDYRMDLIIDNLGTAPSECFFRMNIFKAGQLIYVSTKNDWLVDENIISDDDLPPLADPRWNLPVMAVLPNWKDGVLERLSWKTDIMDSESDAEQRRPVRRHARRSFEVSFLRKGTQRTQLDTFFVAAGGGKPFLLPLWHDYAIAIEGLTEGSPQLTFAAANLNIREFRTGDMVLVNNGDPTDYDVLLAGTVDNDSIEWDTPPPRHWPPGTRLYPMRISRLLETPSLTNVTDQVGVARVRFTQQEVYEIPESFGTPQNGQPLFSFIPNRVDPIEFTYARKSFTLDNESAQPAITETGEFAVVNMQASLLLSGRQEVFNFRQFIAAARGRTRHFFCPSFEHDVFLAKDIVAGDIYVQTGITGQWEYLDRQEPVRTLMAFYMKDDVTVIYSLIVKVMPVYKKDADGVALQPLQLEGEIFQVDSALPEIKRKDVVRVSFVSETRFDQDDFEIFHVTSGSRAVRSVVVMRQTKNPRITGAS